MNSPNLTPCVLFWRSQVQDDDFGTISWPRDAARYRWPDQLQDGADEFRAFVRQVLQRGQMKLVLNLRSVPYIDSTGLGEIVRAYTTATRLGGTLKLLHVGDRVQELLATTRLAAVFDSFDVEADAV